MFFFDVDGPSVSARIWMENCRVAYDILSLEHPQKVAMELVSNEQCSPLFPICTFGLLDVLNAITWPAHTDWNEVNDHGHTALYAASFFGHTEIVVFLLNKGADSNLQCGRLGSALHCAAYQGHTEVVKSLLFHGADARVGVKFDSAIHAACRGNQEAVALAIMDHTAMADQGQYESALEVISEAGFSQALEKLQGDALSHTTKASKTTQMITKTIISGKVVNLRYLTRKHPLADVAPSGSVAMSALHGQEAMTGYLLNQGMDITEVGELGSPLRCASLNGSTSVCNLLLSRGANVNGNERFGSALHAAAMKDHLHIVKLLLDVGANVNIKGGYYGSPLQAAAYQGHKEIVSLLVQAGADLQQSGFSKDAFHAAAEGGHHDIIQLLLASGFTLSEPIRYNGPMARMGPPPPRNLLREASLEGRRTMRRWRRRYGTRNEFDNRDSDSEDEAQKNESIDSSNPTPYARAYVPVRRGRFSNDDESGRHTHNYPLEAAAACGHLKVVRDILAQHDFLGLDDSSIQSALIAACKNGHRVIAEEILSRVEDDNIPLREGLQEAASHAHVSVVRILLAHDRAAESRVERLKATLIASIAGDKQTFYDIFQVIEDELSWTEVKDMLLECLSEAAEGDRADVLELVITSCGPVDQESLISILMDTCKKGKAAAVKPLYEAMPLSGLSSSQYSKFIRLAVENGHADIVRYLLPPFIERGKAKYSRATILVAAGCGYVDILELLLDNFGTDDHQLLQQALNLTCAYLLSKSIDPRERAPTVTWGDISVDRDNDWFETVSRSSDSDSEINNEKQKKKKLRRERAKKRRFNEDGNVELPLSTGEVNAIESCIVGFKRFNDNDKISRILRNSWFKEVTKEAQDSTMRLILERVPSLNDRVWDEALCAAVTLCAPNLVVLMLEKGANAKARHGKLTALEFAVRRECLSFSVVQALIEKGADQGLDEQELGRVLTQAASFFHEHTGRPNNQGALFPQTESLRDVFTTGSGGVVQHVLQRLPTEHVSSVQYSVVLQCAAAVGLTDVVALLLGHKVDANRAGSYYGTALQAASRFGHAGIVKLLLDAGSDPNIRQGRHHTALQAAVVGKSLECVNLLLQAGADTELSANWSYTANQEDDPTPLQLAVMHKLPIIAQALIAAGADVNVKREHQQPLLIQACGLGDIPLICALLESGADVQVQGHKFPQRGSINKSEVSGIHAAIEAGRVDVIEFLLSAGFCLSVEFPGGHAPLVLAACNGDTAVIEALLRAEPSVSDEIMVKSLREATRCSNFTVTERLLYHRPSVLDKGNGVSILESACRKGDLNIVELLLEELSYRGEVQSACTAVLNNPPKGRVQALETILEYVPCTVDLFVEACAQGYERIVEAGLQQRISPSAVDSEGRPALHLAVMRRSLTVAELLLASGADPNAQHPAYGMPLRAALELCAIQNLTVRELPDPIKSHACLLTRRDPTTDASLGGLHYARRGRRSRTLDYQQAQQFEKTVQLLLKKGATSNPPQGLFGGLLTLAAFTGVSNVFQMLLQSGARNAVGGYLQSPLIAAIEGSHMALAREILELTSDTGGIGDAGGNALHTACEKSNLPAVKLLLLHGIDCQVRNEKGDTPLRVCLANVAKIRSWHRLQGERSHADIIVHLLLDATSSTATTDHDLVAAAEIEDEDVRTVILQRMMARAESAYFPEEAYAALIKGSRHRARERDLVRTILDEKRLQRITTRILAVVESPDLLTRLLDYDQTYVITPETFDAVVSNRGMYNRQMADLLLQRDLSFIPSESNILTFIKQRVFSAVHNRSARGDYVLETMFSRNPRLQVTEEMLVTVKHSKDLKVLLARTTKEKGIVTAAVTAALAKNYDDFRALFKMFLEFDPDLVIPVELANHLIYYEGVDGVEQLLNRDSDMLISETALLGLVQDGSRGASRSKREDPHGDLVKLLREHRGQWSFTQKVREAVDHQFKEESEKRLKDLYYSLADADEDGKREL